MNTSQRDVSPGFGRTIILVDDDALQRKAVRLRLELAGFVVREVSSAADAVVEASLEAPDAIVSDVLMDDIDGFSLCRTLRGDPALTDVPVILVSAYFDDVADRALAREVGANGLVLRSPDMQQGIECIVRSLAEGPTTTPPPEGAIQEHTHRLAHQLYLQQTQKARAEARFLALFEHANDAISLVSPDGIVLDVNRRWEAITGRPRAALIGLHVRNFSALGSEAAITEEYRENVARATAQSGPVPIRRADGSTMLMEFSASTFDLDGTPMVLAIGRDVTAVVESQRLLAASERRHRSLVENIPDVFWSARVSDFRFTFVSGNAEKLTGFTAEECLARVPGPSRMHPDDVAHARAVIAAALATREPLDFDCRWQHRDGRWIWIRCRAALARDENGDECLDGVCSDITQRKSLEAQLVRSQKIEAIGQLTAGIAHDFNNILGVILANAEYFSDHFQGEGGEIAREITAAARRGGELTSRLLAFARNRVSKTQQTDLNAVVHGMRPMLAHAVGKGVVLTTAPCAGLGTIVADKGEIEQILMNLAINARDAMPHGGQLGITTENVDVRLDESSRGGKPGAGRYVALRVQDTGTGMNEETRQRLFEPFFTTKAEKGTGLGLSTTYGIVRRHGGHIRVDSALGAGTTFTIYFPRSDAASRTETRSVLPHLAAQSRRRYSQPAPAPDQG